MAFPKSGESLAKMGVQSGQSPGCTPIFAFFRDFRLVCRLSRSYVLLGEYRGGVLCDITLVKRRG
jgi:hypothetical protein